MHNAMYQHTAGYQRISESHQNRGCFHVGEKSGWMSKKGNCDCPETPQPLQGSTKQNQGACKAHTAHKGIHEAKHEATARGDISPLGRARPLLTGPSVLLPRHQATSSPVALGQRSCGRAVPGATAPAAGCRGLPTAFARERLGAGTRLCQANACSSCLYQFP